MKEEFMGLETTKSNNKVVELWKKMKKQHPNIVQFLVFFIISNGVTVLQMVLMPLIKYIFGFTTLVSTTFQIIPAGHNLDGSIYYVFDYAKGAISSGGGGGLAYFLAVEITLLIAQVINFFLQRNVTFKSNSSIGKAAFWYFVSWVIISIGAAALQGLYKTPTYTFLIGKFGESLGTTMADIVTMLINCIISFWVFFPVMKIIFKEKKNSL
jgi:putative flippase GtrA